MERQNRLNHSIIVFMGIMHLVGLIGFLTPSLIPTFQLLIPFQLLLMTTLLLWRQESEYSTSFWIFILLTWFIGYGVEVIGTKTGMIFGDYSYGSALGLKLFDVPLLIGVNWILLTYCIGVLFSKLNAHNAFKIVGAAGTMVLFDVIIEPVAIKYDYWSWELTDVPFQNYIGWFFVSLIVQGLFFTIRPLPKNKTAIPLLLFLFLFFLILNIA